MARWHSCNILRAGGDARRVWQFDAHSGDFKLNREESAPAGQPLSAGLVTKSWRSLWQPKLNVAWLPPESVFLRVVHLPSSGFDEALSMVELQLEKVSPIPVTQVVWSVQPVPGGAAGLQTFIVILAERKWVEEFLGQLEGQGYLADRLELPVLDQLLVTTVNEDGAWIYPGAWGGRSTAMVAWWYGGVLQNLNFVTLNAVDHAAGLKEQLTQMVWAGELEGWLIAPPAWHLVADKESAAEWESPLRQGLNEPIVVSAPLAPAELAALTAKRAVDAPAKANLLPAEFSTRYQQQFVDRLWMRGLSAVAILYGIVVAIYFIALGFLNYQTGRAEDQVKAWSNDYTNAMQLKARGLVLKSRQELKFAALDCWKAVADLAPKSITLDYFVLSEGKKLRLDGTTTADAVKELIEFGRALPKTQKDGQPMFDTSKTEPLTYQQMQNNVTWHLGLAIKRADSDE